MTIPNRTTPSVQTHADELTTPIREAFEKVAREAYDRGAMEATVVANEVTQKARQEVCNEISTWARSHRDGHRQDYYVHYDDLIAYIESLIK